MTTNFWVGRIEYVVHGTEEQFWVRRADGRHTTLSEILRTAAARALWQAETALEFAAVQS
jgi:hypothetical protein